MGKERRHVELSYVAATVCRSRSTFKPLLQPPSTLPRAAKLSFSHCKRKPLSTVSFGEKNFDQPFSFDRFHSLRKEEKESN